MKKTTLPFDDLYTAIYERLTTDAASSAYDGYSSVPGDASFPYWTFSGSTGIPFDTQSTTGTEATVTLRCVTKSAAGTGSLNPLFSMMSDLTEALTRSALDLGTSHKAVVSRREMADPLPERTDGGYAYREGVLRFRYKIQEL